MIVAFCTTCKNRTQHLKETLPRNLADNPGSNVKFVVLDYGSKDDLRPYILERHGDALRSGKLTVYHFPNKGAFHMAHAKNMAHRLGMIEGADILVNLDADNLTGSGFGDYLAHMFTGTKGYPVFLWGNMIKGVLPRGVNGRIAVSRNAFVKAGGYDEKFACWSPDDQDFHRRLRQLGYSGIEIATVYLDAVRHNDKTRFKEYPEAEANSGHYDYRGQPGGVRTVSNAGNAGCGTVYRYGDEERVVLRPFPTRIFGIGMHKTATTSLHHALNILGLDCAHWKSAKWAKFIWREMRERGHSPTLERNYSLCDLPIPLLFRELDAAYPGSKFILTTRDEKGWLETVRKHWDPAHNQFRAGWDHDPFSHRMHRILYGRSDFDAEVFLERYRRHNAEVREYFRHRPSDLLEMPMDAGAGWKELCGFLGLAIPAVPYPKAYAAY